MEVALFYKYCTVCDPESTAASQEELCTSLGLTGRVRIAGEGINGLLAGAPESLRKYCAEMDSRPPFDSIHYKLSAAEADPFEGELFCRVAQEITATGPQMKAVDPTKPGATGQHLSPREFHEAVLRCRADNERLAAAEPGAKSENEAGGEAEARPRAVLIDTRNHYETAVGGFAGSVDPKLRSFAQFPGWVEANREELRGCDVFLYCTGGVRCEKASGYLASLGVARSVSQLAGGIHAYLEEFCPEARGAGLRTVGALPGESLANSAARPTGPAGAVYEGEGEGSSAQVSAPPVSPPSHSPRPEDIAGAVPGAVPGTACQWEGANFSFDARGGGGLAGACGSKAGSKCSYCGQPWHELSAQVVCAVCKDQVLVCPPCREDCRRRAAEEARERAAKKARAAGTAAVGAPEGRVGEAGGDAAVYDESGARKPIGRTEAHAPPPPPPQQPLPSGKDGPAPRVTGVGPRKMPPPGASSERATKAAPGGMGPGAAPKERGVNFAKRLDAERASSYLCPEHSLLGPGWKAFLARATELHGLPAFAIRSARASLAAQLAASKGRGGARRRRALATQIGRLDEWLRSGYCAPEGPEEPEEPDGAGGGGGSGARSPLSNTESDAGNRPGLPQKPQGSQVQAPGFAPFFPLLSLWETPA